MFFAKNAVYIFILVSLILVEFTGCSTFRSIFGEAKPEPHKPIASPFGDYRRDRNDPAETVVLRTKKGDRTVEVEIPGEAQKLSDFAIPLSPTFMESGRVPASMDSGDGKFDYSYKNRPYSPSDYEITKQLTKPSEELAKKRLELETALNLTEGEAFSSEHPNPEVSSYLGGLDTIKQLFKEKRYEAALLNTDDMIRKYQNDPKLHEMRGTLLERIGNKDLALKSWEQALKFSPNNLNLRKFVEKKRSLANARAP